MAPTQFRGGRGLRAHEASQNLNWTPKTGSQQYNRGRCAHLGPQNLAYARAREALNVRDQNWYHFALKMLFENNILLFELIKLEFKVGFYKVINPKHARSDEEMLCKCFDKCSKALAINTG